MTTVAATTPRTRSRPRSAHTDYGAPAVQDVLQNRGLLDSGLTTAMTRAILFGLSGPCAVLLRAELSDARYRRAPARPRGP